jgi:hypothetical protein
VRPDRIGDERSAASERVGEVVREVDRLLLADILDVVARPVEPVSEPALGDLKGVGVSANIPATRWTAGRCRPIDFLQERRLTTR